MKTVASKALRVLALAQSFDEDSSTSTPFRDEGVPTKSLQLATGSNSVTETFKLPPREEVEQDSPSSDLSPSVIQPAPRPVPVWKPVVRLVSPYAW
ncbi:hypothetical protein CF326_g6624 [Tilletia indica]|nr:hypothetical protein CF326_g6624 [Tilletia indica]